MCGCKTKSKHACGVNICARNIRVAHDSFKKESELPHPSKVSDWLFCFFLPFFKKGAVKRPSRPVNAEKVHRSMGRVRGSKKRLGALLFKELLALYWRVFKYLHRATGSASVPFSSILTIEYNNVFYRLQKVSDFCWDWTEERVGPRSGGIGQISSRSLLLRGFLEEFLKVWPTLVF